MSSAEFTDWIAFFLIEPHGYDLENWRWGMQTSNIVNAIRSTVPGNKQSFKTEEFYPTKTGSQLTAGQRDYVERKKSKRKQK